MSWFGILRDLIRYAMSAGAVLAVKLGLMWLSLPRLTPALAYLVVHIVIFFASYFIHTKASFRTGFSLVRMRSYFGAVALFKLLDYLLFAVFFAALDINALWCVVLASFPIFLVRFLVVRRALTGPMPQQEA